MMSLPSPHTPLPTRRGGRKGGPRPDFPAIIKPCHSPREIPESPYLPHC